jgi:hypothetical protein
VDNYVDKRHLTSRKGSIDAGFNKMPILKAKMKPLQIKDLRAHLTTMRTQHQQIPTNSYNGG